MFVFYGCCPHCNSDRGFAAFGMSEYLISDRDYIKDPLPPMRIRTNETMVEFSLAGSCLACKKPVVATCTSPNSVRETVRRCLDDPARTELKTVKVVSIFPNPWQPYNHPALPDKVRDAFADLQKMLHDGMGPHFVLGGCRTVLEASARELGGEGDSLYKRIDDLFGKGVITKSLADWAAIIRTYGNGAVHEMAGTADQAAEMVEFTKLFLQFTFELPYSIARARAACGKP